VSVDDLRAAGNVIAHALSAPAAGVQAWWCALAWTDADVASAQAMLSPAEAARAARFGTPVLRARYISGRATLRMLLARWLDIDPRLVKLARGERGRPYIDAVDAPDFNVSHTRDAALIAISGSMRIGVDVERRDRSVDATRLARKFLTPREQAAMARCEGDAAREYFLRLWTCKESMSKATGDGLAAPMSRLSVDVSGEHLHLHDGPAPYAPGDWTLVTIDVPATHVATAALWRPSHVPD